MNTTLVDALWYLGRGTGLVSLVLPTLAVALGIATRSGRPGVGLPRFGVAALHRNTSLLAVLFLVVHIVTLLFDPYAQLSLVDVVVPFQGAYRPLWLGFGTLGLDLLLVITVSSLLRNRIGLRLWRAIHLTAYAAWPVALVHGLGNGTDADQLWFRMVAAACVVVVGAALAWRLTGNLAEHSRPVVAPAGPRRVLSAVNWRAPS